MIKPYYEQDGITIYHGDCRDVLPTLADGSVDLVLTDPPYGVNAAAWDKRVPYELLDDFLRLTSGPIAWFGASAMLPTDMQSFAVPPQRVLVWYVTFSLAKTAAHGMFYRWHPIYCWQLPKKHDGPKWDVLPIAQNGHDEWNHPATKPMKVMLPLVGFCRQGGVILDPFLGSGTTLVAAKESGRRAIGIEIEEKYCEIAVKRLAQSVLPLEVSA